MIQRSRVALIAARNFDAGRVAFVVVYHGLCCGRGMGGYWFITTWDSIGSKDPSQAHLHDEHLVYEVASITKRQGHKDGFEMLIVGEMRRGVLNRVGSVNGTS
jgi:hypothetical protein